MWIMAASPISKIFLTRAHVKGEEKDGVTKLMPMTRWLKNNPERILDEEIPFTITVPRSQGALSIPFNKPVDVNALLPHQKNEKGKDAVDAESVYKFLIGELDPEACDMWGIAPLEITSDILTAMFSDPTQAQKQFGTELVQQRKVARDVAHHRVMKQCGKIYKNLMSQFQRNKENGMGFYKPTDTEYLAIWVMKNVAKVDVENEQDRQFSEGLMRMMNEIAVG